MSETKTEVAPEKKTETKPETERKLVEVKAEEGGQLIGSSFDQQLQVAKIFSQSKMMPAAFDDPAKVFVGLQLCYELGLKPITSMRNIYIINGTPNLFGDTPLAMVRASGKMRSFKEKILDKDYNEICLDNKNLHAEPYVGFCRTERSDDGTVVETTFTIADADKAGLRNKPEKPWVKYPRRMLQMRARGQNLKDNFTDVLMGVAIGEYDHNTIVEELDPAKNNRIEHPKTQSDRTRELNATIVDAEVCEPESEDLAEGSQVVEVMKSEESNTDLFENFKGEAK